MAWHTLGWNPVAFSEIEPFPSAVLAHRFPHIPNLGDMTNFKEWPDDLAPDILVGGTPCQSFSVAGLRAGLADPRGSLMLTYLAIAGKYQPRWIVWENVPGVLSSNGGRDFAALLQGLAQLGYGFAYRILDAQYFGVPQRRRRVFVVGYLGDWRLAAAVLFERHSLSGHPAPSRKAGEGITHDIAPCIGASGRGFERTGDTRGQDAVVPVCMSTGQAGAEINDRIAPTLNAAFGEKLGLDNQHIDSGAGLFVHTLNCNHEAPIACYPINTQIATRHKSMGKGTGFGIAADGDPAYTLQSAHGHAVACFKGGQGSSAGGIGYSEQNAPTLSSASGSNRTPALPQSMRVRRLTPTECERLQGFPDNYTNVPYRNKPAADGPRYKALGNSMAVPVMAWIGERIDATAKARILMVTNS